MLAECMATEYQRMFQIENSLLVPDLQEYHASATRTYWNVRDKKARHFNPAGGETVAIDRRSRKHAVKSSIQISEKR